MTRRGRRVLVVVAVAASLVLGACADVGGGTTDAAPGTSMATTGDTQPATTTTTTPPPATSVLLPTLKEAAADLPGYNVYRPVDPAAGGEPLPVIVWANGGCFRHDATWSSLLDRWAAAGFVVVAITTPPEGQGAATDRFSVADQAAAVDWAVQQNEQGAGDLAGMLDLDRVVAAGNSCGGITSLALARSDPRVAAVFVLSGSSIGPGATREQASAVMSEVDVPVGFVVGGPEDIAAAQAAQDYELLAEGIPGFVANRATGDHRAVSTDPAGLAEVAEISLNWLDVALNGNATARQALETNPCAACPPDLWTVQVKGLDEAPAT